MAWTTPKTNWVPTDRFNIGDFNRIKNNIVIIYDMARTVFNRVYIIEPMGDDITTYTPTWSVQYFNAIENNVDVINRNGYNYDIGQKQTFYGNGAFITARELNRIESFAQTYYDKIKPIYDEMPRVPFTLGAYRNVKI
jgi:hypothetical protein